MLAPIEKIFQVSPFTSVFIAIVIGIAFGFVLESAGFGNSRKLALQFYLKDFTVFRVMFTAIITAMTGMIILNSIGILDLSRIFLNTTYLWPGIVGGLIMGVGFAIGGYCPGTSFAGLATVKVDAWLYLIGILFGLFVFGETVPAFREFFFSNNNGDVTIYSALGVKPGVVGFIILVIALGALAGTHVLEKKFGGTEEK